MSLLKEEVIKLAGYKNLVYGEESEYDEEKQYLKEVYTEDDNTIHVDYEVMNIDDMIKK